MHAYNLNNAQPVSKTAHIVYAYGCTWAQMEAHGPNGSTCIKCVKYSQQRLELACSMCT